MILLCAVCFQGGDPLMRNGLNAGILVLMAVTAAVLGGFAYFFVLLARRSRAAARDWEGDGLLGDAFAPPFPGSPPDR
jgi:hypothetical protein